MFIHATRNVIPAPVTRGVVNPIHGTLSLLHISIRRDHVFGPLRTIGACHVDVASLARTIVLPPLFRHLQHLTPAIVVRDFLSGHHRAAGRLTTNHLSFTISTPLGASPRIHRIGLVRSHCIYTVHGNRPVTNGRGFDLSSCLSLARVRVSDHHGKLKRISLTLKGVNVRHGVTLHSRRCLVTSRILRRASVIVAIPRHFTHQRRLRTFGLPIGSIPPIRARLC